jgi:hypothetical protein
MNSWSNRWWNENKFMTDWMYCIGLWAQHKCLWENWYLCRFEQAEVEVLPFVQSRQTIIKMKYIISEAADDVSSAAIGICWLYRMPLIMMSGTIRQTFENDCCAFSEIDDWNWKMTRKPFTNKSLFKLIWSVKDFCLTKKSKWMVFIRVLREVYPHCDFILTEIDEMFKRIESERWALLIRAEHRMKRVWEARPGIYLQDSKFLPVKRHFKIADNRHEITSYQWLQIRGDFILKSDAGGTEKSVGIVNVLREEQLLEIWFYKEDLVEHNWLEKEENQQSFADLSSQNNIGKVIKSYFLCPNFSENFIVNQCFSCKIKWAD